MTTVAAQKERAGETPDFSRYSSYIECAQDGCEPCGIIKSIPSTPLMAVGIEVARALKIYPPGSNLPDARVFSKSSEPGELDGMFSYNLDSLSPVFWKVSREIREREDPKRQVLLGLARAARRAAGGLLVLELKMGEALNGKMRDVYRRWPDQTRVNTLEGLFLFDDQGFDVIALSRDVRLSVFPGRASVETLQRVATFLRRADGLEKLAVAPTTPDTNTPNGFLDEDEVRQLKPPYNLHMAPLYYGLNGHRVFFPMLTTEDDASQNTNGQLTPGDLKLSLYSPHLVESTIIQNGHTLGDAETEAADHPESHKYIPTKPLAPWPRIAGVSTSFPDLPNSYGIKATRTFSVNRPPTSNYSNGLMVPHRK